MSGRLAPVLLVLALAGCAGDGNWHRIERARVERSIEATGQLVSADRVVLMPPVVKNTWNFTIAFMAPEGSQVQAGWQWTRVADTAGYSPVQENNASRRVTRQTVSLIYRQMIDTDWEFRLSYEQIRQSSNLPLFGQDGQLLMLGVAYRFSH